jgi:membrane-associated protein
MTDLILLVHKLGYVGLFLIVFFESFPLTFFLPGDSLLFTTGFLASQGVLDLHILIPTIFVLYFGGTFGYLVSYILGEKIRNYIISSNDKFWFKKKHIEYTEEYYRRYGIKTLIIGRFIPIIRSFSATLAGAVKMDYRSFLIYTFAGGLVWCAGVTSLGYYLGKLIPNVHFYLTPIIIGIIIVSFLPTVYEYYTSRKEKGNAK